MSSPTPLGQGQPSKARSPSPSNANRENAASGPIYQRLPRSDIWFDDGNVILQTSDKMYRVHRGVLSVHSTVFKDMFGVPQPMDQPSIEGCPIVELSDSSNDWDEFLPLLYNMRRNYEQQPNAARISAIPLELMLATLILGHKYNFKTLFDEAVAYLKTIFPSSHSQFEEFWMPGNGNDDYREQVVLANIFRIISVATGVGIRTIVPTALYISTLMIPTRKICSGRDREGGPVHLCEEFRYRVVEAKFSFSQLSMRVMRMPVAKSFFIPRCVETPDACHNLYTGWFSNYPQDTNSPLKFFLDSQKHTYEVPQMCAPCRQSVIDCLEATRTGIFAKVPECFDLPPWDTLTDMV